MVVAVFMRREHPEMKGTSHEDLLDQQQWRRATRLLETGLVGQGMSRPDTGTVPVVGITWSLCGCDSHPSGVEVTACPP